MLVEPYVRPPVAPRLVLVDPQGRYIAEDGQLADTDDLTAQERCFTLWDIARILLNNGQGEALCWNNEDVRWRPERHPEDGDRWQARRSDVFVLRWPFDENILPLPSLLAELGRWRDWLAEEGAASTGTTGSAAMSLLKATLDAPLACSDGATPPLLQTRGGRQELGPRGAGSWTGRCLQLDLPAAYASELGGLAYGGRWLHTDDLTRPLEQYAEQGLPVFARARIRVPRSMLFGPLLKRQHRRMHHAEAFIRSQTVDQDGRSILYPAGRLQGVWTWQELQVALEAGCKLEQLFEGWVHRSSRRPFEQWWQAIQRGRELGQVAGSLAKMTGNALVGRFSLDPRIQGHRTVRHLERGRMVAYPLRQNPFQWPAHDLAETVTGRTRARLTGAMLLLGERVLSAHTDGIWVVDTPELELQRLLPGWRVKQRADRLDLINPQKLRYQVRGCWHYVYAGVPFGEQQLRFEQEWERMQASS